MTSTEIEKKLFDAANKCDAGTVIEMITTDVARTFRRFSINNCRTAARVILRHEHFLTIDDPTRLILTACCESTSYVQLYVQHLLENDEKKTHPEISIESKQRALELARMHGNWITVVALYKNLGTDVRSITQWFGECFERFVKTNKSVDTNLKRFWNIFNKEAYPELTPECVKQLRDLIKERIEVYGDPDRSWEKFYNETLLSFPGDPLDPKTAPPPPYEERRFCLIM